MLKILLISWSLFACAIGTPLKEKLVTGLSNRTVNNTGFVDGYFYYYWSDGAGDVTWSLGSGGQYSVTWKNAGNFILGKGYNPGAARTISYSGTFSPQGNAYLSIYGWTKNSSPLIEYYVVENYGTYNPSTGGSKKGTIATDGGVYDVVSYSHKEGPSIGINSYVTYYSIRKSKRTSGTVTLANHFSAWENFGMNLGTVFDYQIVATEGYQSSGSASITVLPQPSPTSSSSESPSPSASPSPDSSNCAERYLQCGGQYYTGVKCCKNSTCTVKSICKFSCSLQ
ncbi:hypothetical protein HK098_004151 [Nowakowskiella sp. JEL0407]|nr:hypothetical protein HK098_004151 [Nowakowskiella sp. JEL0407]